MADDRSSKLDTSEREAEAADERTTYLRDGRTVAVSGAGDHDVVEIRSPGGLVELRVKITEDGPVLQLEGVRLEMKAAESVDIECQRFSVKAAEKAEVTSEGEVEVRSDKEMTIESSDDLRVRGKIIHLN